jgi:hypothetical protein
MSKSIQRISFGQIGNCPVVVGAGKTYVYNATIKRWRDLPERRKPEVIPIKPATFLRRFGALVDRLPPVLRDLAPPLRIASDGGQTAAFCRSGSTGYFDTSEQVADGFRATAKVTQLEPFIAKRRRQEGTFDLGRHQYSGGPGFSWTCEYRIVRLDDDGQEWDLLSTTEESDGYESMGTHSLEAAQEYFDGVGFHISRDSWEAMGAKFPVEEAEDEATEDDTDDECFPAEDECALCREPLSKVDSRGYHDCHPEFKS